LALKIRSLGGNLDYLAFLPVTTNGSFLSGNEFQRLDIFSLNNDGFSFLFETELPIALTKESNPHISYADDGFIEASLSSGPTLLVNDDCVVEAKVVLHSESGLNSYMYSSNAPPKDDTSKETTIRCYSNKEEEKSKDIDTVSVASKVDDSPLGIAVELPSSEGISIAVISTPRFLTVSLLYIATHHSININYHQSIDSRR
jgi:hypothetical protein